MRALLGDRAGTGRDPAARRTAEGVLGAGASLISREAGRRAGIGTSSLPSPFAPVVQMEDTAGSSATVQPVVTPSTPAQAPSAEPASAGAIAETTRGGPAAALGSDDWHFDFHGYLRAPMRVGLGHNDKPAAGQSSSSLHAPVVPDDQYLSWQHTKHNEKDWAELFLSYGNAWAKGTVALQGFNFTDAAWTDTTAQFGISQGYVTITPELPYENVRLAWKVGSFWNRYGTAGRYDAGEYDTYLFGRTHAMGETLRAEIDLDKLTVGIEHGIGAKRPSPSIYNRARFTLLHHAHADATYDKWATLGLHYLRSWASEEDRAGTIDVGLPDGSLGVAGADLRLDGNQYGYLYFGFSHISADHAVTVAPAIEVLNSNGGGEFRLGVTDNYLDSPGCIPVVPGSAPAADRCSGGTGSVNTLLGQYQFSFANLMANLKDPGSRFWGEGQDVKIALYAMYNKVASEDPKMDGVAKVKYGTDVTFNALPWFGVALRADRVQPNDNIPEQSFAVLSPRLIFRTKWVTHEEIQIQYSRYFYNQRTCPAGINPANDGYEKGQEFCAQPASAPVLPDGFGATATNQDPNTRGAPTTTPDLNVVKVQASMWW